MAEANIAGFVGFGFVQSFQRKQFNRHSSVESHGRGRTVQSRNNKAESLHHCPHEFFLSRRTSTHDLSSKPLTFIPSDEVNAAVYKHEEERDQVEGRGATHCRRKKVMRLSVDGCMHKRGAIGIDRIFGPCPVLRGERLSRRLSFSIALTGPSLRYWHETLSLSRLNISKDIRETVEEVFGEDSGWDME